MSPTDPIAAPTWPPAVTRLAPSPTGALHLGNARTFLINWALARRGGWRILLRIEDLDTPRVKPGAAEGLMSTLSWLGVDWDAPPGGSRERPPVQSQDLEPYRAAMRVLAAKGVAYPCALSRTQIEAAASAPQDSSAPGEPHETPYPASLRPVEAGRMLDFDRVEREWSRARAEPPNWRLVTPQGAVRFTDLFAGEREFEPARIAGDFVLWTKRGQPSYQLAVVVDDHRQGVTRVVRGDDLLDSAARQLLLYRALGYTARTGGGEPAYLHLPLVVGTDGRRLAKRHGDTRVDSYRERGVGADAVVGLIAWWSGAARERRAMGAPEFMERFDLNTMTRGPVVFTSEDDQWLMSFARS